MAKFIEEEATSLEEWITRPGFTPRGCTPDKIDVGQTIHNIYFRYSMMTAAMSCLYNKFKFDLAIAASREGIPPVIHYNQSIDDQVNIIKAVKKNKISKGDIEFLDEYVSVDHEDTLESVLKMTEKYGHSVIPAIDKFRNFHGVFIKPFYDIKLSLDTKVKNLPEPLYYKKEALTCGNVSMSDETIKSMFEDMGRKEGELKQSFLPIIDNVDLGRLIKLAFKQKYEAYYCGAAINTKEEWQERAERCAEAGSDFTVIDTSHGHTEFQMDTLVDYRELIENLKKSSEEHRILLPELPICGGNIVTADAFFYLADHVDFIKIGMMTGAACKSGAVKNMGLPLCTALREVEEARNTYYKEHSRYIPMIADGGIGDTDVMLTAFAVADLIMVGKCAAQLYESAGLGIDRDGKITDDENYIKEKEYWGEGSPKAKNLERYAHTTIKTFVEEGEYGFVSFRGRLKPIIEEDFKAIRSTISNCGALNMKEYREKAVLQKLSQEGIKKKYPSQEMRVVKKSLST